MLAILMTFLCSNLYSIQYVNGEDYANQSVARSYETQTVPASRGPILDRNGKVLVSNQISYQVTLSLSLMGETAEERCANLLTLIQVCREEGGDLGGHPAHHHHGAPSPIPRRTPFTR